MSHGSKARSLAVVVIASALTWSACASASETIAYTYDARGRLVGVAHTGSVNSGTTTAYAYDKADNRTKLTVTGAHPLLLVVPLNGFSIIPINRDGT